MIYIPWHCIHEYLQFFKLDEAMRQTDEKAVQITTELGARLSVRYPRAEVFLAAFLRVPERLLRFANAQNRPLYLGSEDIL